jgi:hypothetical protein
MPAGATAARRRHTSFGDLLMADEHQSATAFQPPLGTRHETAEGSVYEARLERWRWLCLVRALRIAISGRMLVPAAAGVFLTVLGWWLLAWVFGGSGDPWLIANLAGYRSCPFTTHAATDEPPQPGGSLIMRGPETLLDGPDIGHHSRWPLADAWQQLSAPVRQLFDRQLSFVGLAFLLLCGLWVIAVWALVGGAIVRLAAVQLTREEKIPWKQAFSHALAKWQSYFAAPLMPLLGVLLMTVPMALVGVLMRTNVGLLVVGLLWPLYLLAGVLMAIFLVGLLFGWPLMWAAIGTEESDSFDALSRAYSYVYQRALKYLLYAAIAMVLGALGGLFVWGFAAAVIHLAHWASEWGSGYAPREVNTVGQWGVNLLQFWDGVVRLFALGFVYSYLWTASTAIYLLLRHDVDGTEMDEVHVDEEQESFGLPPLKRDEAGVPDVAEEPVGRGAPGSPSESSGHETGLA